MTYLRYPAGFLDGHDSGVKDPWGVHEVEGAGGGLGED